MIVIKQTQKDEVLGLASEMGLSYSLRSFEFDNIKYYEVITNANPLRFMINKKITDEETRKIFYEG